MSALTIEEARTQISDLEQRLQKYEDKYGCSYDLFAYRTATDEEYIRQLNAVQATQEWEGDLISWEFDVEELREWRRRLRDLLTLSSIREAGPTWTTASQDDEWRDGGEFARQMIANNRELFEKLAQL
ncbi:MAG: hypothetical protein NT169_27695 [Chloroflexi bacterium]|nr:hypothetical protein [Chloroflexota bacterium]